VVVRRRGRTPGREEQKNMKKKRERKVIGEVEQQTRQRSLGKEYPDKKELPRAGEKKGGQKKKKKKLRSATKENGGGKKGKVHKKHSGTRQLT